MISAFFEQLRCLEKACCTGQLEEVGEAPGVGRGCPWGEAAQPALGPAAERQARALGSSVTCTRLIGLRCAILLAGRLPLAPASATCSLARGLQMFC